MSAVNRARALAQPPWLWQVVGEQAWLDSPGYRWLVTNRVMRDDTTGVTIAYRDRSPLDEVCGARVESPRPEQGELVCNVVGDHAEMPHIGAPAGCVDQTCEHWREGRRHLVVIGVRIVRPSALADGLHVEPRPDS